MEITINGTLRNDQTVGLQDDDDAIGATLSGLSTRFQNFLNGTALAPAPNIPVSLALDAAQKAFADSVEAVISSSTFVTVDPEGGAVDDLFFSDGSGGLLNGDQVFISAGVPLQTVSGSNVYLHSYDNGNIVLATTSATEGAGDVVAAFYLNEAGNHLSASVEMVTFMAIDHPNATDPDDSINWTDLLNITGTGTLSFDFDNLESGNFLWVAIGTGSGGLLVTGQDLNVNETGGSKQGNMVKGGSDPSDSVNTSQGGINATIGINAQHFTDGPKVGGADTDGPIAVFTLTTGFVPLINNPLEQATGGNVKQIDYSNYLNTSGGSVFISQTTGNANAMMRISLVNASLVGGVPEEGYHNAPNPYIGNDDDDTALKNDAAVNVGGVTIRGNSWAWNEANIAMGVSKGGITVSIIDNVITVNGVTTADTIDFTARSGTFNRFLVQGLAGTADFDIGRIDIDNVAGDTEAVGGSLFVDDDGPGIGPIPDSIVDFATGAGGTVTNVSLEGATGTDPNSAPYTLVDWTGKDEAVPSINGVALTAVPNATGTNPVTAVSYWGNTNGVAGIQTTGPNPDLEFYRLTLSQTANMGEGGYTFQVLQPPPILEITFGFGAQPSGQNLFGIIPTNPGNTTGSPPTLPDGGLLFFNSGVKLDANGQYISSNADPTMNSSTVNTSKGGGEVSIGYGANNYTADDQDAFFVFADNPAVSAASGLGLTATTADDADTVRFNGTNEASSASVEIVKIVGSKEAGVTIKAYNLDPTNSGTLLNIDTDGEARSLLTNPLAFGGPGNAAVMVNINGVSVMRITNSGTTTVFSANDLNNDGDFTDAGEQGANTGNVTVTLNADRSITVLGLDTNADYTIRYNTKDPHDLSKVEYEAGSYNIGGFNVFQALDSPDQRFDFTARATDGDGDWVEDSWSIGIDGTGANDDGMVSGVNPPVMPLLPLSSSIENVQNNDLWLM